MAEKALAGSLRARLLRRLAILLALLLLFGGLSAYWNGRAAADTAYDRTLLASARAIADGLVTHEGVLRANVPYVALDTFAYDSAGRIYYGVLDIQGRLVAAHFGSYPAWMHGKHCQPDILAEFCGKGTGQVIERRLAGAVQRHAHSGA